MNVSGKGSFGNLGTGPAWIVGAIPGWKDGDWVWCMHCERVYKVGEFRMVGNRQMCPYRGCTGDAVDDAWHWEKFAQANHHPEIPERDRFYPIFWKSGDVFVEHED